MTWTWWMTLLAIFAALVLIGCIPVGVDARYNAEGVFLAAKLGPIRRQLLPQKPKKKRKQQKQQKKPEKAPEKAASQEKKPNPILSGGVDEILQLLDIVLDTLGDLRRKLRVNELTLYVRILVLSVSAAATIRQRPLWAMAGPGPPSARSRRL